MKVTNSKDVVAPDRLILDKARRAATGNALADVFWALLNSPEFILNH